MAKSNSKVQSSKLALVGGETLLGKDITEVLESRTPSAAITRFAATGEGNFGEVEGEAIYVEALDEKAIAGTSIVVLAGTAGGAQKTYNLAKAANGRPIVIDCTGDLDNQPEARIVAPLACEVETSGSWLYCIAHPAASALALTLKRLARFRAIKQSIAHVFEPASERGQRGISELHQQTTSLLAFKPLEKKVFDAQLSYNLLPQYGEEAPTTLSSVEQRIERHLASLLSSDQCQIAAVHMPSLRTVAVPVFHGYSVSLWVEFEASVTAGELGEALASAQIEVRAQDEEPPENVGAAGQSGLIAGDIRVDHNNGRAAWIWLVGDNLRLTADAAADLVSKLESRGA